VRTWRFAPLVAILPAVILLLTAPSSSIAAVSSSPTFELDGANPSSLATSGATSWRDLISNGSITGALSGNAAYNSAGGGSLSTSGASTYGGVAFPATSAGTPTNPSGDMTLMMWVKFSSFNAEWNLLASRWFTNSVGAENQDWHFAVRTSGSSRYLNLYTTNKPNTFGTTAFATDTWYLVGFTLTWSGNLQFYVNGVPDGPLVTGASRNANTSAQLWISDNRTNCGACAMNGNIAKVRLWNSKLESSTVLNDFNVEREIFGYAPFVTSASFTLANNAPKFRVVDTITATVPAGSKVTFYENSKVIAGCKRISPVSTTAICRWRPSSHGQMNVRVAYTPSGSSTVNWSAITTVYGSRRSGLR